jgi:hypothetical protein
MTSTARKTVPRFTNGLNFANPAYSTSQDTRLYVTTITAIRTGSV